jgi:hypothetical protein
MFFFFFSIFDCLSFDYDFFFNLKMFVPFIVRVYFNFYVYLSLGFVYFLRYGCFLRSICPYLKGVGNM